MSQPFEGAASEVSDTAYGMAWFAFYRIPVEAVKYFAEHHPAERVKEQAKAVLRDLGERYDHEHD